MEYLSAAFGGLNWLTFVLCIVFCFAFNFIWFGPGVFGDLWLKASSMKKMTEAQQKEGMKKSMLLELVAVILRIFLLAAFLELFAISQWMQAAMLAFVLWLGVIVPANISRFAWEKVNFTILWINGLASLLTMIGVAVILVLM